MHKRYLLIDRDGTLIAEKDNLHDPAGVVIIPGAIEVLSEFVQAGWGIIVVTNQSGIARGIFSVEQMHQVHDRIAKDLEPHGIKIEKFYFCPHAPEISKCTCRKPNTGMVDLAVSELNFDPTQSLMVGDKGIDIQLGKNIGAKTVLVLTGYGSKARDLADTHPDYIIESLAQLSLEMA